MAVHQRRRLQSQAEAALSAAESEKRDAWQAIDRVTAELDRTRERADRAEYELGALKIPSRTSDETQELLKARQTRAEFIVNTISLLSFDINTLNLRKCSFAVGL